VHSDDLKMALQAFRQTRADLDMALDNFEEAVEDVEASKPRRERED